jgi:AcrR family transcriptional regulator
MKAQLIQQYIHHTLEHHATPQSTYLFAKEAGLTEAEFYTHFASLEALEMDIYTRWFDETFERCASSEPWQAYSSREKVLALFYTFFEVILAHRSFVQFMDKRDAFGLPKWPGYLKTLRGTFGANIKPILAQGIESKELAERKFLDDKYVDGLWVNFLFVLKFWIKDQSTAFEKTDAAIEKSVNLGMDLMGKGPLDAALDFGKFLFQNR